MPEFSVPNESPETALDPLQESKEVLRGAAEALRSAVAQFGADWRQVGGALPPEGCANETGILTQVPPGDSENVADTGQNVSFWVALRDGQASVCTVGERCVRCSDVARSENAHVFHQSGIVSPEKIGGRAIESIDDEGNARTVEEGRLYDFRRQESARQAKEAASAVSVIESLKRTVVGTLARVASALPQFHIGRMEIGGSRRSNLLSQRELLATEHVGDLVEAVSVPKPELEASLLRHANALQSVAAILNAHAQTLLTRIAEQKQQAAAQAAAEQSKPPAPEQSP